MDIQYSVPTAQRKVYTKQYRKFAGVDFSTGVTEVSDGRSPYAPNMVCDTTGFPEKRPGYMSLLSAKFSGRCYGLFPFDNDGVKMIIGHYGTSLYACVIAEPITDITEIYTGMAAADSTFFIMNGKMYILDGTNYMQYDGTDCVTVDSVAKVPTTTIAAPAAGGGEKYESINLLQPKRMNSWQGETSAVDYYLDTDSVDSVDLVEKLNGSGGWDVISTGYSLVNSGDSSYIHFTAAPVSDAAGPDNLRATFTKEVAGYADRIKKCTIAAFYGISSDNRIFASGNPDWPNQDWQSAIMDPTYFMDDGYSIVGSENSAIMGYLKQYDSLVIVKEDSDQDATQYLRTANIADDGTITYPLKQGLVGIGAVAKKTFGILRDDPLFLSKNGVFGIESSAVTYQRTTQLRSYYVNHALCREPNMQLACAAVWNGWYCLFVNSRVYVANSQQDNRNKTGSKGYEWYYWTGIPAVCVREFEGSLYFGTVDGDLCKFTTYDEYGLAAYWDDGDPIVARWSTKMDDMEDFMRYKTLMRRGVGLLAKPYVLTSGKIYFANENELEILANEYDNQLNTFDFSDLTFASFNFNGVTNPRVIPINKKLRNTGLLQIIVENDQGGQGFGIYGIQLRYVYTKDVKK